MCIYETALIVIILRWKIVTGHGYHKECFRLTKDGRLGDPDVKNMQRLGTRSMVHGSTSIH